jgi:hypothetical protein
MAYFDNLDNESLNKYKINLKNGKKKLYRCVQISNFKFQILEPIWIDDHSNFM